MTKQAAHEFLLRVRDDAGFRQRLAHASTRQERHALIAGEGFTFTRHEFDAAKTDLSDWAAATLEDADFLSSDRRPSGLEFCCCCNVAGPPRDK